MDMSELCRDQHVGSSPSGKFLPAPPKTLAETGVPEQLIFSLALRHFYCAGDLSVACLSARLALPGSVVRTLLNRLRAAGVVMPLSVAEDGALQTWALTPSGRQRSAEARACCRYEDVLPVSLEAYQLSLRSQALRLSPSQRDLGRALSGLAFESHTIDQLGVALASMRSFIVHGPPGSGRSSLVKAIGDVEGGAIWIPRFVLVGEHIATLYDPRWHVAVDDHSAGFGAETQSISSGYQRTSALHGNPTHGAPSPYDHRWVRIRRPLVIVNAEHDQTAFEFVCDPINNAWIAPLQMKAANGWMVVDDTFGPSRLRRATISRLAESLDAGVAALASPCNGRVDIPLQFRLVTVESQAPSRVGYHRLGIRFGPSVAVMPLTPLTYRRAARCAAERLGVRCSEEAIDFLVDTLHQASAVPRLASIPNEVFRWLSDEARCLDREPVIDPESLGRAWRALFDQSIGDQSR